jgi:hypothetical protein
MTWVEGSVMRFASGAHPAVTLSLSQQSFLEQAAQTAGNPRPRSRVAVRGWDAIAYSLARLGLVTLHSNAAGTVVLATLTLPSPLIDGR